MRLYSVVMFVIACWAADKVWLRINGVGLLFTHNKAAMHVD